MMIALVWAVTKRHLVWVRHYELQSHFGNQFLRHEPLRYVYFEFVISLRRIIRYLGLPSSLIQIHLPVLYMK